ncbi:MAG: hypothetical protein AAFQ94_31075 [Bacteroidota bacterium]
MKSLSQFALSVSQVQKIKGSGTGSTGGSGGLNPIQHSVAYAELGLTVVEQQSQ